MVFPTTDVCSVRLGWANKQKNGRPFFQISAPVPGKTEGSGGMRAGIKPHSPSAPPLAGLRAASGRVWRGSVRKSGGPGAHWAQLNALVKMRLKRAEALIEIRRRLGGRLPQPYRCCWLGTFLFTFFDFETGNEQQAPPAAQCRPQNKKK